MGGLVFVFPRNRALDEVLQEVVRDRTKLIGQSILPFVEEQTQMVEWDEEDHEQGKTSAHVMGTEPRIAGRPGSKTHRYEPIPHKEQELIKEDEMLKARQLGTLAGVVNLNDLVMKRFNAGVNKDWITVEAEIWQALLGHLVVNENGVRVDETFPVQEFTPTTPYDDLENATPLADWNACKLLFRNTGASMQGAKEYMNSKTLNRIIENRNTDDLRGFNDGLRAVTFDVDGLNKINKARGYPEIVEYDEGWEDEDAQFNLFIPDGKSVIVGKRTLGQNAGDYVLTPSLHRQKNGLPAPGFFAFVTINGQGNSSGSTSVSLDQLGAASNPKVGVIHGVYGGPRIKFPRSIIKRNLF